MLLAEFGTGQVFWSMLWFFLFFIWIWILIIVFSDIFRSHDLSGWGKALWTIFVIVVPYLGVFVYLIARGRKMQEHAVQAAQAQDAAMREYVQSVPPPAVAVPPTRSRSSPTSATGRHQRGRVPAGQGQGVVLSRRSVRWLRAPRSARPRRRRPIDVSGRPGEVRLDQRARSAPGRCSSRRAPRAPSPLGRGAARRRRGRGRSARAGRGRRRSRAWA